MNRHKRNKEQTDKTRIPVRDNDDLASQRSSLRTRVNLDHQTTQITSHTIHIYSRDGTQTELCGSTNYKQQKTLHVARDTFL